MEQPHGDLQKQQELEQHEVQEVLGFLRRYGSLIGAGVAAAALVALGSMGFRHYQAGRTAAAEQALMAARTPEELAEIVTRYGSTPAAPAALLNLAKTEFNNGETAQARAHYEQFLQDFRKNDMKPVAELGLAYCSEAEGDFNGAAKAFLAFAEAHAGHWLHPSSVRGAARCLKQANRSDEARILLEDFLTYNPGSRWTGAVEDDLQQLGTTH